MSDGSNVDSNLLDALRKAQSGDIKGAEQTIQFIRSTWAVENSPELMVNLMIIEGVCGVCSGKTDYARDRISRALVVAKVSRRSECIYSASAWMAYLYMIEGEMRKAADIVISGCIGRPVNLVPLAEFRCASILAVLFEYFGSSTAAASWFERTRILASRTGLPGMYSSTLYNMAVARINASYLSRLQNEELKRDARLDLLLARSAFNYDDIAGVHVLDPLHYLIESQALYLCDQIPLAIEGVEKFLAGSADVSNRFRIRGEFDLLRYKIANDIIPNFDQVRRLESLMCIFHADDDLAIVKHVLAESFGILGAVDVADRLRAESTSHLRLHKEMCESILLDFERASLLSSSVGLE